MAAEQRVEVHKRRDGSTYTTTWTKTEWHRVNCGQRSVWEDDCDDYYMGTDHVCSECGARFRHPKSGSEEGEEVPAVLK